MITSSAPGKVFLFGEHAVVYGEPAVAAAIDLRVEIGAEEIEGSSVYVEARDLDWSGEIGPGSGVPEELEYVKEATRAVEAEGVRLEIESEIPVGSGLGSSAAVTVATLKALSDLLGRGLTRRDAASMGHQVERAVQGSASPTDTYVSAFGGVNLVEPGSGRFEKLEVEDPPLVVGDTGASGSTWEQVSGVRRLRDRYGAARRVIETIGDLSRVGVEALEGGDLECVGELMDINHGLLEALGVSTPGLSRLVHAAREGGALGAKITGAGGGGCFVALGSWGDLETPIRGAGGSPLGVTVDGEGVR